MFVVLCGAWSAIVCLNMHTCDVISRSRRIPTLLSLPLALATKADKTEISLGMEPDRDRKRPRGSDWELERDGNENWKWVKSRNGRIGE